MVEFFYTLDQEEHKQRLFLVVAIQAPGQKRQLYRDSLQASSKDRELLTVFMQAELQFRGLSSHSAQAETVPFNRIRIAEERTLSILPKLGVTGRLFWKEKKLLVDPFTPVDYFYEVSTGAGGAWLVRAQPSDLILLPGDPPWVIQGGVLRMLAVDKRWVLMGEKRIEEAQKERFIDQIELPRAPKMIWKIEKTPEREVLPFLLLSDRFGGFADLWMDYGEGRTVAFHDPKKVAWRTLEREKSWEKDLLETDFIKKTTDSSHYYCPLDKVAKSLTFLLEIGWPVFDYRNRRVVREQKRDLELEVGADAIAVRGKIAYGAHQADLTDVLGAFNRRERFVDLSPQTVGLIESPLLSELADQEITAAGVVLKKSHFGILEPFFPEMAQNPHFRQLTEIASAPPGAGFLGTLHPYQQEGVDWLQFLHNSDFHGLLADEMGLGKTVQVLALVSRLSFSKPLLVIVPTSLLFNWRREIEKFLPAQSYYIHSGSKRQQEGQLLQGERIILTSYALLRQDSSLLESISYSAVILDEAQCIKNPDSQIAQAVFRLKGDFRLAITGTPIENRWDELWSLFYFLMPELLGDRRAFHAQMLAGMSDVRYLHQLKKKVRPFLLRRRKDQIGEQLPPKYEQTVWVEMQEEQRAFYEEWLAKQRSGLLRKVREEGIGSHRMEILEAILRLRQICCDPRLVDKNSPSVSSAKLERLMEDLESVVAEGRKVLIYSQFTQMLKLIEGQVQEKNYSYVYLDGSSQNREALVQRFQEDPQTQLFLISLKAGGVGLNLTAADYVFLFDPWWNDAVEQQAIDRAHRFGRKNPVIARRYVAALSIEEKIMHLKQRKSALAQGLLDLEQGFAQLTLQDLFELLS